MFGLGFWEVLVIGLVLLVVVGPRELPRLLRTMGRGIHKLRTMSTELRDQSGIDEIIRDEGLREDLDAIRSLSRGRVVDAIMRPSPPRRGSVGTDLIGPDPYAEQTGDAEPDDNGESEGESRTAPEDKEANDTGGRSPEQRSQSQERTKEHGAQRRPAGVEADDEEPSEL